ncbi:MAG TPA: hypothetical protein VED00_03740 [archaeon]|nr:hypothetical protein [archaeon]
MKTPLCNFCLKSGVLCPSCEERLKRGEISELDVRMAKFLFKLENKYPSLSDVQFYKAVEADGVLAILVNRSSIPKMLSYSGKIVHEIYSETGKRVRVLEHSGDVRKFLEDLFTPANIITINKIWLPGDSTETRVILSERDMRRLPADVDTLKELAKKIRGMTIRVEFEKEKR